jgi:hypothetical protein
MIRKPKQAIPIVWEDIQDRANRMGIKVVNTFDAGIVVHIGGRTFFNLDPVETSELFLAFEATFAELGFDCYACMRVTLEAVQPTGYRLCRGCLDAML